MAATNTITAWILFIVGLYSFCAAIGELRRPGGWARMLWEMEQSRALQFLTGLITLVIGAAAYLVNPYNPADWASILVTVIGAWMMLEGVALLAIPDLFMRFANKIMDRGSQLWAWASLAIGAALLFVSFVCFLSAQ